jgi:hypothetical protein
MKTGMSLSQLAAEVERQQASKRDFVADTRKTTLTPDASSLTLGDLGTFDLTEVAHGQVAEHLKVPRPFYDRLKTFHPDLLSDTVNTLFQREHKRRMVRTLDGKARAFLSDRYRPLDNADLLAAVMPVILQMGDGVRVESMTVTDSRLYIKAVFPKIEGEVKVGDPVQAGVVISNSEIGLGSLSVMPMLYRLVCLNGAIMSTFGQRQYHIGKRAAAEEQAYEMFSDETLRADDNAFWLKVRDTVKAAANEVGFRRMLDLARTSAGQPIVGDPTAVIEVTAKRYNINEAERSAILRSLIEGGDLSQWGLANAVTAVSQDVESYDRATELERVGGSLIELPTSEWSVLSRAA